MKAIIDFGLVVLIWLVQLIIYPSFQYIDKAQLSVWHSKYTVLITFVVMPLMFGQVALHGLDLYRKPELMNGLQVALITVVWALTFLKAVPLHNQIQTGANLTEAIPELIKWNWPRTIIWSLIFLITFLRTQTQSTLTN